MESPLLSPNPLPSSISHQEFPSSLPASYPPRPIIATYYKLETAAREVARLRAQIGSLRDYINYNSAHGFWQKRTVSVKRLERMGVELGMWEGRMVCIISFFPLTVSIALAKD